METLLLYLLLAFLLIPGLIFIQWQSLREFKQSGEADDLTLVVRHLRFIFAIVIEALAIYCMILQLMSDSPLAE